MALVLAALALLSAPIPRVQEPAIAPERQVHWQHTLDDALALARAEHRQLLIAINADGESASEAIVRERYRDPQWVAATRPFVCVIGSVFRHTPRDYDADGRRIPCPRFGDVTCGEHIAMEPLVYEAYLKGARIDLFGEEVGRISPRHALVDPDGEKQFDLFLLFDLRELDRTIAAAGAGLQPREPWTIEDLAGWGPSPDQPALRALAGERDGAARTFFERWLAGADEAGRWNASTAILHAGGRGSLGALRVLLARAAGGPLVERLGYVARVLGLGPGFADAVRARFGDLDGLEVELATGAAADQAPWIRALARVDPKSRATRDLALTFLVFGSPAERAAAAAHAANLELGGVPDAVDGAGGLFDLEAFLAETRASPATPEAPAAATSADERSIDERIADLEAVGARLDAQPGDPELQAQVGREMLGLAMARIDAGGAGGGIPFLLEDARTNLLAAAKGLPDDASPWLDLAHVAYLRSDFEEEERYAVSAAQVLGLEPDAVPADRSGTEAVRWLADAGARLTLARAEAAPAERAAVMTRAVHALALATRCPGADATDWESLASFCGANGRPVAAARCAAAGLERFPEADPLRALLQQRLAARPILLWNYYADLATRHPDSGACVWYAGYAAVQAAEWHRREERAMESEAAYRAAAERFQRAMELVPRFKSSSELYLAYCALGRGFAHLIDDDRDAAAADVLDAARWRPFVGNKPDMMVSFRPFATALRDGLGRETVDLVDGVLEHRASGPSPVDPEAWLDRLAEVDPRNSAWPRMVSDAELREGLRAVGRGDGPTGRAYCRAAVAAGRRAVAIVAPDEAEENAKALAQAATVLAEMLLEPAEPAAEDLLEARARLLEAAPLVDVEPPAPVAGPDELRATAAALRAALGAARPVARPGR